MSEKIRFISVAECDYGFYDCLDAGDLENASSYYESLKIHYQNRGKKIKQLKEEINRLTATNKQEAENG